jgi:hypothetical protein
MQPSHPAVRDLPDHLAMAFGDDLALPIAKRPLTSGPAGTLHSRRGIHDTFRVPFVLNAGEQDVPR